MVQPSSLRAPTHIYTRIQTVCVRVRFQPLSMMSMIPLSASSAPPVADLVGLTKGESNHHERDPLLRLCGLRLCACVAPLLQAHCT